MIYKQRRRLIEIPCSGCGALHTKPVTEYKRNTQLGRRNFCSRKCSLKEGKKKLFTLPLSPARLEVLKSLHTKKELKRLPCHRFRYLLRCMKSRKDKETSVTLQDLQDQWERQEGKCIYSGIPLILCTDPKNPRIPYAVRASVDRIDSLVGYIPGNVQFVSTLINYMKSTISHEETIEFCKLISKNYCPCYQEDQTISSPVLGAGGSGLAVASLVVEPS